MPKDNWNIRNLKVGDLVTHVLYGPEWIGMIVSIQEDKEATDMTRVKALVQIQPGTKYDGFFTKRISEKNKVNDNLGYVSINWLFRAEKKRK